MGKNAEIYKRVREVDVAILVETKSKRMDHFRIPGYNVLMHNDNRQGEGGMGGVAIFSRNYFTVEELDRQGRDIESVEWTGCRIKTMEGYLNIIEVYRRPGPIIRKIRWNKLLRGINNKEGIIIAGDFNAHNRIWNCKSTDRVGDDLQEDMLDEDMYIINRDTEFRVGEGNQCNSNIDLIFASENLVDKIDYEQGQDTWESDHFPINFELRINSSVYRKTTNRISTKKRIGMNIRELCGGKN